MSTTFDAPQSRNEAILQNFLGAENELGEPQSRIEYLLMELLEAWQNLEPGGSGNLPSTTDASAGDYLKLDSSKDPEWAALDLSGFSEKPTIETVSGSTLTLTAADNHVYICGELSSLSVSSFPATGAFIVIFDSGSVATGCDWGTLVMPDDFTEEANMHYEINVLNGYALCAGWSNAS